MDYLVREEYGHQYACYKSQQKWIVDEIADCTQGNTNEHAFNVLHFLSVDESTHSDSTAYASNDNIPRVEQVHLMPLPS